MRSQATRLRRLWSSPTTKSLNASMNSRAHPFSIPKPSVGVEFGRQGGRSHCDEEASSEPISCCTFHG